MATGTAEGRHEVCGACGKDGKTLWTAPRDDGWSNAMVRDHGSTGVGACGDRGHGGSVAVLAPGGARGWAPRWKVSMMIMRPPQHGQG